MSNMRLAVFRSVALGAMLVGLAACSDETVVEQAPVRPVKVVEVKAPDDGRLMQYSGSVRARTEISLGFRVDGKITERLVDVGQRVKAGDVLAKLDPVDYELSVRQAEAQLASAEKQMEISKLALRRAGILQEKSITSQSTLEQSQLAYEQALSSRDAAASALEQARNRVSYANLTATVDGIVTAVNAEAGQVVAAGSAVLSVAADGAKEVEIAVPEGDIAQFKPGKSVKATFWSNSGLSLEGKVREVAGSANSQSRTFLVRVSLPENENVLLGMTATVVAKADDAVPAFVLPLAALATQEGKSVVWLVDRSNQTVHPRAVTVAGVSLDGVRVSDGIAAGDLVVSAGTQFMRSDMKIRVYEGGTQSAGETNGAGAATRS